MGLLVAQVIALHTEAAPLHIGRHQEKLDLVKGTQKLVLGDDKKLPEEVKQVGTLHSWEVQSCRPDTSQVGHRRRRRDNSGRENLICHGSRKGLSNVSVHRSRTRHYFDTVALVSS